MGFIQDLQQRKLTGCRGCDAIRKALYKGADLWTPDQRIYTGSAHESFDESTLGAFVESPLKGRGSGGLSICPATVLSITSVSGTRSTSAGTKTLGGSADEVVIRRTTTGGDPDADANDFCYALTCTGQTSGQTFDFRGSFISSSNYRADAISTGATDIMDRMTKTGSQINWRIIFDSGNPGWVGSEDVSCECAPGALFALSTSFQLTLEGPSPGPPHEFPLCTGGDFETPQAGLFLNESPLNPTADWPQLSGFGSDGYVAMGNVGIPGREDLAYTGRVGEFATHANGAQFDDPTKFGVDAGDSCWSAITGTDTFFRLKYDSDPDVDGRVEYIAQTISPGHFGAGDLTIQMLGISLAL